MTRKVFVSGCFDLLHSGHLAFLKTAAAFGDLYVGVAQDRTIELLKGIAPVNTEAERLFMVKSVRWVKEAWISSGAGLMDFSQDLERLRPDTFIVNEDGHCPEKAELCTQLGIEYQVLGRAPEPGLPARSTSELRLSGTLRGDVLPYRAEICGAWLDQPFVNRLSPGYVICAQLAPHSAFGRQGGGLAGSTRDCLAQLKLAGLTRMKAEDLAKLTFRYENGIDQTSHPVSGAQDALGLCFPGVSFHYYDNGYWPLRIESHMDAETLRWIEAHVSLYPLSPRLPGFDPLRDCNLHRVAAKALAQASALCLSAIEAHSLPNLLESFALCRQAQQMLFPAMFPTRALEEIGSLEAKGHFRGWKFTGAGGGGWVLLLDADGLPEAIPLKIAACNIAQDVI